MKTFLTGIWYRIILATAGLVMCHILAAFVTWDIAPLSNEVARFIWAAIFMACLALPWKV